MVNIPVVLIGACLDEVKALGIRNELGSIQRAANIFDEVLAAFAQSIKINSGTRWQFAFLRSCTLAGRGRQCASEYCFDDGSDRNTKLQTTNASPTAGALLTRSEERRVGQGVG